MAIRVSKLLRETNIGLSTLHEILKALNYSETDISLNTKLPDEIANIVRGFSFHDIDLLTQLLRFILVFLANQRFVFLICFTVFYKF